MKQLKQLKRSRREEILRDVKSAHRGTTENAPPPFQPFSRCFRPSPSHLDFRPFTHPSVNTYDTPSVLNDLSFSLFSRLARAFTPFCSHASVRSRLNPSTYVPFASFYLRDAAAIRVTRIVLSLRSHGINNSRLVGK